MGKLSKICKLINEVTGKNKAITNFIEIKSLWKYQQKEHKKCKGSLST